MTKKRQGSLPSTRRLEIISSNNIYREHAELEYDLLNDDIIAVVVVVVAR